VGTYVQQYQEKYYKNTAFCLPYMLRWKRLLDSDGVSVSSAYFEILNEFFYQGDEYVPKYD
jgi:hypothetical protein